MLTRRQVLAVAGLTGLGLTRGQAQSTPVSQGSSLLISAEQAQAMVGDSDITTVALTSVEEYTTGHIRNARQIDWPALELKDSSSESALQTWRDQVSESLSVLGITESERLLAYDGGTAFACRFAWVMAYLSERTVPIIDGGLPAWQEAGYATQAGAQREYAHSFFRPKINADVLSTLPQVMDLVGDESVALVDVRTPDEYAAGHLPGAVNIPYTLQMYLTGVPTWIPADDRKQMFEEQDVVPEKRVIPYCSSGVRSAVTWFGLRDLGYPHVSLFSGSWAEWSANPDLPVTTGPNP